MRHYRSKRHCSQSCALRYRSTDVRRRIGESVKRRHRADNLARFKDKSKREVYDEAWQAGYQSGRYTYHYKRALLRLLALTDAHLAANPEEPTIVI